MFLQTMQPQRVFRDPGQASWPANIAPPSTNLAVAPQFQTIAEQGAVIDDVMRSTKGDGALRSVYVNGAPVPRELVRYAMFENQDYAPREEAPPQLPVAQELVTTQVRQRSMFGPMPKSPLGMDIIGTTSSIK